MGQSPSRNREPETPSRRSPNSESGNNREASSSSSPSTRKKRRSTVRRSIINLVKPTSRNDDSAGTNGSANGKRKSWLKSRRWSKAPAVHVAEPELEENAVGQAETVAGGTILPAITPKESETAATATTAAATSLAIPLPTALEAQQQQQHQQQENTSHSTHESPQLSDSIAPDAGDPSSISQNRETLDISSSSNPSTQLETSHSRPELASLENAASSIPSQNVDHEDVSLLASPDESELAREITRTEENITLSEEPTNEPASSTQPPEVPPSATSAPNTNTNSNPSPLLQNRPFPPPGTLVVVQGVVHTTDVPRPVPVSTSSPSSPLSNSFPSPTETHDHSQTPTQAATQPQSRLSDSGLGSRIRRSVSNASRPRSEIGSSARNRLSALFSGSRPTSMVGGRPSSSASNMALDEALSSTDSHASPSSSHADATTFRPASGAAASSDSDPSVDVNSSSGSSSVASGSAGRAESESDATTVVSQAPEGSSGSNEEQNQTPRPARDRSQRPSSPQSGMISSSSIDVLGTLLSVAAAATAASLLTGSSDPILPTATGTSPDPPRAGSPGPGADPFVAGLGGVGGLGGLGAGSNIGGVGVGGGANGRTDRMRQAWGNIRDRLGLRPNSISSAASLDVNDGFTAGDTVVGGTGGIGRDENVPLLSDIDGRRSESSERNPTQPRSEPPRAARDRMLAEMARAFQLGLGLTGPPIGGVGENGAGSRPEGLGGAGAGVDPVGFGIGRTRIGELPPEGSFERFLVDLQTDLRTALGGGNQQQQRSHEQEQEPEDDDAGATTRRQGDRENDIDELFRLIAEAEAEVRQRQRVIAERQAALRALMSGATAALESVAAANTQTPSLPDRRARVETILDSDVESSASLPMLEDVSDDSDSEDEAPPPVRHPAPASVASTIENREPERPEGPSMSRLSSMFDRQPPSSSRGVNSISEALNRRRAMGIGRTPPTLPAAEPILNPVLPPLREVPSSSAVPTLGLDIPPAPEPTPAPRTSARVETEESPIPNATSSASTNTDTDAAGTTTESGPSTSPTSEPSNNTTRSQAGSRNPIDDGTGRINWWRLYRFPPIAAPPPRTAAQGLGQTRGSNAATPAHVPTSTNPPSSPLQDSPSLQPNMASVTEPLNSLPGITSTSSTAPQQSPSVIQDQTENQPPQQAAPNTVVPVIVVGLQSVNLTLFGPGAGAAQQPNGAPPAAAAATAPTNTATAANAPSPNVPTENEEDLLAGVGGEQDDTTPRENRQRRWQSRAAEAFRNLRHGRNSPQRPPNGLLPDMLDGPGSRTFLIYVIGGYYPPDHNIVTGDPDTLDSFEALLDLADLLGQFKPPTASKEDIERSGLEVIKAPQVSQYEQEGKISSNCTERCLICLDDYDTEDDVRVLTCKHAFHMNCVDKWLQEGKNNCPACRGAGVTTAS